MHLGTGDSKKCLITKTSSLYPWAANSLLPEQRLSSHLALGHDRPRWSLLSCQVTSKSPQGAATELGAWSSCKAGAGEWGREGTTKLEMSVGGWGSLKCIVSGVAAELDMAPELCVLEVG